MDITIFISNRRDTAELLGDYAVYRRQLSRRILTLRKRLGRTTSKHGKFSAKPPITGEEVRRDVRFVHLLLLTAERAWAHAMQLKALHAEDNAGQGPSGSARKLIISKFNKAARHSNSLLAILTDQSISGASDTDVLEIKAYTNTLIGAEELEKHATPLSGKEGEPAQIWHRCLEAYSIARIIYNSMFRKTKNEVYQEFLTNLVDPAVRYAAYQSQLPRTLPIPTVSLRHFPRDDPSILPLLERLDPDALNEKPAVAAKSGTTDPINVPSTITWRSRTAKIQDASVGQAIGIVNAASERLSTFLNASNEASPRDQAAAYDDVLLAAQDAVDATRHAIEELERERVEESDARMQDLRVTNLSVNYSLIGWRVGRNRVLIGVDDGLSSRVPNVSTTNKRKTRMQNTGPSDTDIGTGRLLSRYRERVVLYDSILQSLDSVRDLAGAGRDASFMAHLAAHSAYFRALKCANIAYAHSKLNQGPNALALLLRAKTLLESEDAASLANTMDVDTEHTARGLEVDSASYSAARQQIARLVHHHTGRVIIDTASNSPGRIPSSNDPPLINRLQTYPSTGVVDLGNLVPYPPSLQPVPVKPLFFDVAWNYIDYPGVGAGAQASAKAEKVGKAEPDQPKKKGWFGFGR